MSTRSTIQIMSKKENKTVILYKHYDGYPSDNLKMINNALGASDFTIPLEKNTPFNNFLDSCAIYYNRDLQEMIQNGSGKIYKYDAELYKSEDYCQHADIEFFYIVDIDLKNVNVYGSGYQCETDQVKNGFTKLSLEELNILDVNTTTLNKSFTLPKTKQFNFYSDSGHGWLKVPVKLLKELDIENKISEYSYINKIVLF